MITNPTATQTLLRTGERTRARAILYSVGIRYTWAQ